MGFEQSVVLYERTVAAVVVDIADVVVVVA